MDWPEDGFGHVPAHDVSGMYSPGRLTSDPRYSTSIQQSEVTGNVDAAEKQQRENNLPRPDGGSHFAGPGNVPAYCFTIFFVVSRPESAETVLSPNPDVSRRFWEV